MTRLNVQFLIDETYAYSIFLNISNDDRTVKDYISLIEDCNINNCDTTYSSDFYINTLPNADKATDLFYSQDALAGEYRDDFLRFNKLLDICSNFDPIDHYSDEPTLTENFQYFINTKKDVGLLTGNTYNTAPWWESNSMKSINNNFIPIHYYRFYIKKLYIDEDVFWEVTEDIFPNIYFNENKAKLRFSNLGAKDHDTIGWIINTLSYLNDYAISDYLDNPGEFKNRASSKDIDLSPESTSTHKDAAKMKLRNIEISGIEICCEWHAKYKYDKGRIHFHIGQNLSPDIHKTAKNKLIVGFFCEHLDT